MISLYLKKLKLDQIADLLGIHYNDKTYESLIAWE